MIEFLGQMYYIDMDVLENFVELKNFEPSSDEDKEHQHFSIIKFELIKMMIEVVLTERLEDMDDNLGLHNAKSTSIPFRIAFNTLLRHNIIKYFD
jgi:hypothetical protein